MKPSNVVITLLMFLLTFLFSGHTLAHTVTFHVHNKCPFTIWPATAPNTGHPVIANGGFSLPQGQIQHFDAPWSWTGRIWARTGCNFSSNWKQSCETGDCDGRLQCNGLIGKPPVTLIQISLNGDKGKPDFYDVSLVDGYNLPVFVSSKPFSTKCSIGGCSRDLKSVCPEELKVRNASGEVVACKSACLEFDRDSFCCRNEYGTPGKCKGSVYSKMFKDACPNYFSYAYDVTAPLVSCVAKEYVVTFCPSAWGGEDEHEHDDSM